MTNKNPFEIRLDVLKMAQDMLDKELEVKTTKYLQQVDAAKRANIEGLASVASNAPVMYTTNEVVSRAASLYSFISDNTSRK